MKQTDKLNKKVSLTQVKEFLEKHIKMRNDSFKNFKLDDSHIKELKAEIICLEILIDDLHIIGRLEEYNKPIKTMSGGTI